MAGTTHYRFKCSNQLGEIWDVQIIDTTYAGTDFLTIYPNNNGFNISWQGDTSTTYTPILAAEFTAIIHNDVNGRALLTAIVAGTDGQFIICLYKYNTATEVYDKMWSGPVMQDSITLPDASSNPPVDYLTLTASDGFGLLKDIPFDDYAIEGLSRSTINNLVWNALSMIPYTSTYRSYDEGGSQTKAVSFASVWYEDSMDSSVVTDANHGDPIMNTYVNQSAFLSVDNYGVVVPLSWYDVLLKCLITFNLQISQWNGTFLVIQQNIYTQDQTRAWHYDWQNDDYITTELIDLKATMPARLTGGVFTHILPVKQVTTEYEYKDGIYGGNLLPYNVDENTEYNCGLSTQNNPVTVEGEIKTTFDDVAGTIVFVRVVYTVQIQNGIHYLHYDETNDVFEWTTTATDYAPVKTGFFKAGNDPLQTRFTQFNWLLPGLPEEGEAITFQWTYLHIEDENGDVYTTTTPVLSHNDVLGSFSFKVEYTDAGEGTILYKATVSNSALADLELENTILGDGLNNYSAGAIAVINSSDVIVNSNGWTIYAEIGGTAIAINSLRCKEMIALRRTTVQIYEGTFYGIADFHKGFSWLSKSWVWLSMSYDCNTAQFTGAAMAVVLDRTSITIATPLISQESASTGSGSSGTPSGGSTIIENNVGVTDGLFDLSIANNILAVAPYEAQKGDDPGYAYFVSGNMPAKYSNGLTLDGELSAYSYYAYNDDGSQYSYLNYGGLSVWDRDSLNNSWAGVFKGDTDSLLISSYNSHETRAYPIYVGTKLTNDDFNGEYLCIDDYNQVLESYFTSSRFGKSKTTYAEFNAAGELGINTAGTIGAKLHVKTTSTYGKEAVKIEQVDQDQAFIDYEGTSANDTTKNICTMNGGGALSGPRLNNGTDPGFAYAGMIKIEINGTSYWTPYFSIDNP